MSNSTSKPQLPQVNTQVPSQPPLQSQSPQQQQQQQLSPQQQLPPQQLLPPQQQQQQLATPQAPYQQQPYGTAPSSPNNLAPPGSPQPGYAQQAPGYSPTMQQQQPAPPSPQSYYQGYPPAAATQGYQYPPQQFPPSPQAGYAYPAQPPYPGYPPQQYPPPQPGYQQPYQQPMYGAPPPQSQLYDPSWQQPIYTTPTITYPLSQGYLADELAPHYNPQPDADVLFKALSPSSGLNRDGEEALIHILPFLTPQQLESIRQHILLKHGVRVSDLVDKSLSNDFQDLVRAVILGPLAFDVWLLKRAMAGVSYKPVYMDMVLLGRKNGDIKAIETAYHRAYGKHLVDGIKSEMSGGVEALFRNAVEARRADESAPIVDAAIEKDVVELYTAMVGSVEAHVVAEILGTRSDAQIRRITELYNARYGTGKEKKLEDIIVKKFKGHMEDALLYILQGANDRALRDARMLEKTMKGVGTRTEELTYRVASLHWDKAHLADVKEAYKREFPKRTDLITRVKGDTSGNHQKLLLALLA